MLRLGASPPDNSIFNGNGAGPGGTNVNTAGDFSIDWISDDSWIEGNGSASGANTVTGAITFNNPPDTSSLQPLGTFSFDGSNSGNMFHNLALTSGLFNDINSGSSISLELLAADNNYREL